MTRNAISDRIAKLDPDRDHQEIARLLSQHVFPWDSERALEFALFRTFAVPSISRLLAATGEFSERPRKRYDDTELILYELAENGYDSPRGQLAIRRMNEMHGRYEISNDEFLYVLSTFVCAPINWMQQFAKRPFTPQEQRSIFLFYLEIGKRMGIQDLPVSLDEMQEFNHRFESRHFQFAESNREIGDRTLSLFLGFFCPRMLRPWARYVLFCVMDENLLDAFQYPHPPQWLRWLVGRAMAVRRLVLSWLPERTHPVVGTRRKRPTYPQGYEIRDLGTFR